MGKIITFANSKGGVGKSSNSILMAYALYHRDYKVLLVDIDPQRNLSKCVNAELNAPTTMELLLDDVTAEEAIQKLEFFDIIPSRKELTCVEAQMPLSGRLKKLKKALASVKNSYDFIIIDTPPNLGLLSVNALIAADEVIVPSSASAFSIEGFLDFYQTVRDIQEDDNPNLVVRGVLISMFNPRTLISKDLAVSIKDINDKYKINTFDARIRTSTFIAESQLYKFDPFIEDPTNIACIDFNNFLDEFLGGK